MQIEDLALEVGPARYLGDAAAVQAVITGIGIGLGGSRESR